MSLSILLTELELQIMLSVDYRSVVRLGSVDRHFRDLHVTVGSAQKQDELLWLELFDPESI
jgi:hypothetical protein